MIDSDEHEVTSSVRVNFRLDAVLFHLAEPDVKYSHHSLFMLGVMP